MKWSHYLPDLTTVAKHILLVEYIDTQMVTQDILSKTWRALLDKLEPNTTSILTGDINIDIIKFENDETCNYLSTLLSHRYLPYITLPTRISTFSATCIDHVFIKPARNNPSQVNDIVCDLLYCDISNPLPCFVSLKLQRAHVMKDRTNTRIFGERNCSKFVNMMESGGHYLLMMLTGIQTFY